MNDNTKVKVEGKPMSGRRAFLTIMGVIVALTAMAIAPAVVIAAWGWLL